MSSLEPSPIQKYNFERSAYRWVLARDPAGFESFGINSKKLASVSQARKAFYESCWEGAKQIIRSREGKFERTSFFDEVIRKGLSYGTCFKIDALSESDLDKLGILRDGSNNSVYHLAGFNTSSDFFADDVNANVTRKQLYTPHVPSSYKTAATRYPPFSRKMNVDTPSVNIVPALPSPVSHDDLKELEIKDSSPEYRHQPCGSKSVHGAPLVAETLELKPGPVGAQQVLHKIGKLLEDDMPSGGGKATVTKSVRDGVMCVLVQIPVAAEEDTATIPTELEESKFSLGAPAEKAIGVPRSKTNSNSTGQGQGWSGSVASKSSSSRPAPAKRHLGASWLAQAPCPAAKRPRPAVMPQVTLDGAACAKFADATPSGVFDVLAFGDEPTAHPSKLPGWNDANVLDNLDIEILSSLVF